MPLFKLLHIATIFAAIIVSYGPNMVLVPVARSGNVLAIRTAFRAVQRYALVIPILYVFGGVFGVIAIFAGNYNPLSPWLIIAYVLFIIGMVEGAAFSGPWVARVGKAAEASPEDEPSPALKAAAYSRSANLWRQVGYVVILLLVIDMVIKPGFGF